MNRTGTLPGRWRNTAILFAVAAPFVAFFLQWTFWAAIKPYAWFLFFPAVFFSAWVGGLRGAIVATVVSTLLAWWFFISPEHGFTLANPVAFVSIALFMSMGVLFGVSQERVHRANAATAHALATAEASNENLQQANAKITQLYEKTLELDRLKTDFFANVSHELRTPLTLILGPVSRRLGMDRLADDERHDLEIVDRNARLLFRHVSDLLDIARLEGGHMPMQYTRVDLARLTRVAASHFEILARERQVDFVVRTPATVLATVDAAKCERILLNLLSNAFKFTPLGGRVTCSLAAAGERAIITVADNGPGIPPALREAVFERFRQIDGGAARSFGGTGLGLAIVKEFCALHGGTVGLAEAPGGGASFSVDLPLNPAGIDLPAATTESTIPDAGNTILSQAMIGELRTRAASVNADNSRPGAPLILVVEDNPDMSDFLTRTLSDHYHVAAAFDGREGLDLARRLRPELILSDVMMPRLSGPQLVAALGDDPLTRDIPIVMLSAKADEALAASLIGAGVRDYVAKPFATDVLLAKIGSILAERAQTVSRLDESAAYAGQIFNAAPNAMLVTDADGRIERVNDSAATLFGYAAQALEGALVEVLIPEPLRAAHVGQREAFVRDLRRRDMSSGQELFGRRSDGRTFPIDAGLAPARIGGQTKIIVTIVDISRRKQAETAVRQLNAELEQRVAERTAELAAANRELETFSYSVSHDLKAPLRGIDGYSRLLEQDHRAQLDEEGRLFLHNIRQGTEQMHDMIEDMLAYSRMERRQLADSPIALGPLVEAVLAERAEEITACGAQVDVGIGVGQIALRADHDGLATVLRNLLENALKFSRDATPPHIEIDARAEGDTVLLWVRDNGIGFDMKYHERIFEIFSRLERAEDYPGTGVGLAIVRKAVQRMKGRVWADSAPRLGATFFVELPA